MEEIMRRVLAFFAYFYALLCMVIVLNVFVNNEKLAQILVHSTDLHVSPWMTGGNILDVEERNGLGISIHKPVFKGILFNRSKGFVQIDLAGTKENLSETIEQLIDYDRDNRNDFKLIINPKTDEVHVIPLVEHVTGGTRVYKIKNGYVVRVELFFN
jgi:hypothetical protein